MGHVYPDGVKSGDEDDNAGERHTLISLCLDFVPGETLESSGVVEGTLGKAQAQEEAEERVFADDILPQQEDNKPRPIPSRKNKKKKKKSLGKKLSGDVEGETPTGETQQGSGLGWTAVLLIGVPVLLIGGFFIAKTLANKNNQQ